MNQSKLYEFYFDSNFTNSSMFIKADRQEINLEILKNILSDQYFNEIIKVYNEKIPHIAFCIKNDNGISPFLGNYSLSSISKALEQIINMDLSIQEMERIRMLTSLNSFETFIQNEGNKTMSCILDGIKYTVTIKEMIDFLQAEDNLYKKMLKRKNYKQNLPTEVIAYFIKCFYIKNESIEKYVLPEKLLERMRDISESRVIDIEAIDKMPKTNCCWLDQIKIDAELEKKVLDSIPSNLNITEKAIYLYILLCKVFSYDPYYFGYDPDAPFNFKHKSIEGISEINIQNNWLVCYEFNNIYGYFLHKIGVNYNIPFSDIYVNHTSINFKVGKFLVSADSVTSVLAGDLVRCKVGFPIIGLQVSNRNMNTQNEFAKIINKVYKMFAVEKHDILVDNILSLSIIERVMLLIEYVNKFHLDIMDKYAYVFLLKKVLFTSDELEKLSYVILRDNVGSNLTAIITVLSDEVNHYVYKYNQPLKEISANELKEKLDNNELSYISSYLGRIPLEKQPIKKKKLF